MAAPAGGRPRRDQAANSALLSLPEPILVHILLQLVDKSGLYARADALSALSFMLTCKQVAHLVASSDEVWAAMLRAELFVPEEAGKLHSARARFLQLRRLSLSGFWRVVGHYATGEEYTYRMQLCDVSNSHIWAEEEEGAADDPWAAELGVGLQFHFGIAGLPNVPRRDAQRCDWVIGDVAGPWRMRILAKCTNNMIIFNECATDEHNGNWCEVQGARATTRHASPAQHRRSHNGLCPPCPALPSQGQHLLRRHLRRRHANGGHVDADARTPRDRLAGHVGHV